MKPKPIYLLIFLVIITLFSFAVRIWRIGEPNHYYFDEVYHVVTAEAYAKNDPAPYDPFSPPPKEGTAYDWLHPPLAKLIQAGSIKIFGDDPTGWRLPSVVFGTLIIPATFILANLLAGPTVAIFASSIIAFENLTFVMSRITMNDVFVTFFVIVAFIFGLLYVRSNKTRDLFLTYLFLGLAVASKWTGLYASLVVVGYILWYKIKVKKIDVKPILFSLLIPAIYLLGYGQFWLQGHTVQQFIDLHKQIWWYQNRRDLQHSYGTTPLYCVPKGLKGPKTFCPWALDVRGVYFSYEKYGDKAGFIYALGNPAIFGAGLVAVSYLVGKFLEERKREYALILLGYFIFWVPFIFSPRILFLHHYLPSIPFLSIALGLVLSAIYKSKYKYLAIGIVLVFVAVFFYFYPITSGYPVDPQSIDNYMWLKTWR